MMPVTDIEGVEVGQILRSESGHVALPFDPDTCVLNLLHERYLGPHGQTLRPSRRLYYRLRPFIPRGAQIRLRRAFARRQTRTTFPCWPADRTLHDFDALVIELLEHALGAKVPAIRPWPKGFEWALVLTHDVERAPGYSYVSDVARRELELGFRSAFFFVPERDYRVERSLLDELRADGFEVGLHGLRHDGADIAVGNLEERLPEMRRYASEWGAIGFRSPATHRSVTTIPALGFDYDSSYSDTAPYEPQPGGTCAVLPYFLEGTVELPITMPMDHTLFEVLDDTDAARWIEKARWLRERGGMALLLTHPDYLLDPRVMRAYEEFLGWAAGDAACWCALPSEISEWWRAREATELVADAGSWRLSGPGLDRAAADVG
jgi:peptidoglycan/xylan/chitin deacetylase (PgdA/CDA1 family)